MVDEICDILRVSRPWRDDCRSFGLAARDFTDGTLREQIIQLRL
jgi:hypothetical protein